MDKNIIISKLLENHNSFINYIASLNKDEFEYSFNNKWTAGQQLNHIILSIKPLNQVFVLPNFLIKLIFGKANRESKNYKELVAKYLNKLENGGKASKRFVPKQILLCQKEELIAKLNDLIKKLIYIISFLKEDELDLLILPHPILGKLTVREMLYFTIYHVEHHHQITKINLENK